MSEERRDDGAGPLLAADQSPGLAGDAAGEPKPSIPDATRAAAASSIAPRPVSDPPRPGSGPPRGISSPPRPSPEQGEPLTGSSSPPEPETTSPATSESSLPPRPRLQSGPDDNEWDSLPPGSKSSDAEGAGDAKDESSEATAADLVAPKPKQPAVAILAMRIVGVEDTDRARPSLEPAAAVEIPPYGDEGSLEELADEEVAPISEEEPALEEGEAQEMSDLEGRPSMDSGPEILITEESPAGLDDLPSDLSLEVMPEEAGEESPAGGADALGRPGPPPRKRRPSGPPAPPSARAVEKALKAPRFDPKKKRGPVWWEEIFGDDFARAILPLTELQARREVDFIESSLGVAKGGIVLDLACGNGQHAVELAARGYNLVGYDLSVSQLAEASELAQGRGQKINFLQGDMREMAFENTFDGIYCWNTSFGYFEEERNVQVAKRVFRALKSGGTFLLDVINRDFAAAQQPNQNWFEGDACVCMDDMSVDFITSRLRVKRTIMLDDGRTRECAYSIRVYGLHELGKLLHDIGFKVIQASGQPALPGVFFGAQSPRVIILASKP